MADKPEAYRPCCGICECKDPPLLLKLTREEVIVKCPNPKCGHIGAIAINDIEGEWDFQAVSAKEQSANS